MANVNARRVEEILTSGITAGHYVAGSNITITENQDGTETIASTGGGGGGTTDYSDLTNKPSINNVTLSGDKTTSDLGIDEVPDITSSDGGKFLRANYYNATNTSDYSWANISSTDITNVLSAAQQNAINSGITSNKVSGYDTIVGQMETFYPKLLDVGTNVGEITAEDLDNLHSGIYEYLGMFTGSTLPTEIAYKTGVVRGYFTQESMAWNVQFQMVETTDGIFGARTYNGSTWSNWTLNVPGGGGTAPTAYTTPTYNTTYVDTASDSTFGGYVVINNICYVNINVKLKSIPSADTFTTIATGLPKPLNSYERVNVLINGTGEGFARISSYDSSLVYKKGTDTSTGEPRYFSVSYLVDTSS